MFVGLDSLAPLAPCTTPALAGGARERSAVQVSKPAKKLSFQLLSKIKFWGVPEFKHIVFLMLGTPKF
jgi:hypothetical protein